MEETKPQDITDDTPLWGAAEIAKVINLSRDKTYYLLEKELIPAKKVGAIWVSTRRQLRAALGVA